MCLSFQLCSGHILDINRAVRLILWRLYLLSTASQYSYWSCCKNLEFLLESVDPGVLQERGTEIQSCNQNPTHVIRRFHHGSVQQHSIVEKSEFSRKGAWKWIFLSFNTLFASEYCPLCFRTSWSKFTASSNWNRHFCQVVFSISSLIL